MKRVIFPLVLFLSIFIISQASALCLQSNNNYASEVLLNKQDIEYKLNLLDNAKNVVVSGNQYILQSEYDSRLAVILEKTEAYLSVKVQIPVKAQQENVQHLVFSSQAITGSLNASNGFYNGWEIYCLAGEPVPQCEFIKGQTNLLFSLITGDSYQLDADSYDLSDCNSCDGICISKSCISQEQVLDINGVINFAGFSSSLENILSSYRVISSGKVAATKIIPELNDSINFNTALKNELIRLRSDGILLITLQDIDKISSLAKQGNAGVNKRIVYDKDNQDWRYYYETNNPTLTRLNECNEFPSALVPTGAVIFDQGTFPAYYFIPIAITLVFIVLFVVLIITARVMETRRQRHRIKPITGLQQA